MTQSLEDPYVLCDPCIQGKIIRAAQFPLYNTNKNYASQIKHMYNTNESYVVQMKITLYQCQFLQYKWNIVAIIWKT